MSHNHLDIDRVLGETFVAQVEHYLRLTSTNDRASQAAAERSDELPLLVVADEQTAGRGRGANRWWTGRDSLALSLLVDARRTRSPLVSLAAAVAVAEMVAARVAPQRAGIHWPNDVFVGGKKLAGILVEALSNGRCVIGIGINTNNSLAEAPPEVRKTATTLLELTGAPHDRTEIVISLLGHLQSAFERLGSEPELLAGRANELCLQRGQTLTLGLGGDTITGVCAGIAPDGALSLDTPQGRKAFYSGVLHG